MVSVALTCLSPVLWEELPWPVLWLYYLCPLMWSQPYAVAEERLQKDRSGLLASFYSLFYKRPSTNGNNLVLSGSHAFSHSKEKAPHQCLMEVDQNMAVKQQPCAHLSVHYHCPVLRSVYFKLILQSHQQGLGLSSMPVKCITSVNTLALLIDEYKKTAPS